MNVEECRKNKTNVETTVLNQSPWIDCQSLSSKRALNRELSYSEWPKYSPTKPTGTVRAMEVDWTL